MRWRKYKRVEYVRFERDNFRIVGADDTGYVLSVRGADGIDYPLSSFLSVSEAKRLAGIVESACDRGERA